MTYYDLIKSFSVDDMAEFMTDLCRDRDLYCLEQLHEAGIDASLVSLAREIQVEMNKQQLLRKLGDIRENL
jgi:DUF1680 family protein